MSPQAHRTLSVKKTELLIAFIYNRVILHGWGCPAPASLISIRLCLTTEFFIHQGVLWLRQRISDSDGVLSQYDDLSSCWRGSHPVRKIYENLSYIKPTDLAVIAAKEALVKSAFSRTWIKWCSATCIGQHDALFLPRHVLLSPSVTVPPPWFSAFANGIQK